MTKISINCQLCSITHQVDRTPEIPAHVTSLCCNWCPDCHEKAKGPYKEWYNEQDNSDKTEPVPDNQLMMPFLLDEITADQEQLKQVKQIK